MADNDQKLAYFEEITGMTDSSLSHQILEAYGWDLDSAVQAMVDKPSNSTNPESMRVSGSGSSSADAQATTAETGPGMSSAGTSSTPPLNNNNNNPLSATDLWTPSIPVGEQGFVDDRSLFERIADGREVQYDATTQGLDGALRLSGIPTQPNTGPVVPVPSGESEASSFIRAFERQYGDHHPEFQAVSFMEALRRAGHEFKFLFVYLHSAENVNTAAFCETTLQNEAVVDFINENFIAWGADVHETEGYHMSTSLNASTCPFCAIISGSSTENFAVVRQVEGYRTAGELLTMLQNVIEEQSASLIAGLQEQEARDLNYRLREEQDEAYRIALQADQERERRERAEEDQAARERLDADQKKVQEEKEAAEAAQILARKEANLAQLRRDKALNLGPEPERGADVTHVAVRLPTGERKERRFFNTTKVQALYDYIESLNIVESDNFLLISNFPRVVYGPDKVDLTLKDAGLHPRTNLFVQVQDS